jgi:hypothetical protein
MLLGGLPPDLRIGPRPEAAREVTSDVELHVRVRHQKGLGVGVDGDELDPLQTDVDHPVDGVDTPAADPDHLDHRKVVLRSRRHGDLLSIPQALLEGFCGPRPRRVSPGHGAEHRVHPQLESYSYVNL